MVGLIRILSAVTACLWLSFPAVAQTLEVDPDDLTLTVTTETLAATPFRQEMILLTIHGIYKRHITLEKLEQPDFGGFNWMQLGQDHWFESMLDGRPVKNMRRRMAIFPEGTGLLRIGSFQHNLTLLDEDNKWFEHTILSPPIEIDVAPEPQGDDWWFPVRRLKVSDDWSNAPDQLEPGAGVLRVIRISALGASPDMIPPMPELKSPSALIFAHPEKRLVDLTPRGPEAIAFWRWTVTPTNGRSAILEPIEFTYFDTIERKQRSVVISAQRVAFGDAAPSLTAAAQEPPRQTQLRPSILAGAALVAFMAAFTALSRGQVASLAPLRNWLTRQRLLRRLSRAARQQDAPELRRAAHQLNRLYEPSEARVTLLHDMDRALFNRDGTGFDAAAFRRDFRQSLRVPRADPLPGDRQKPTNDIPLA